MKPGHDKQPSQCLLAARETGVASASPIARQQRRRECHARDIGGPSMRSDGSTGLRVAGHQTCVVYDKKTGEGRPYSRLHSHSRAPSRRRRSMSKRARCSLRGNSRPRIKLDRLKVLHVAPEELEKAVAPMVDVKARKLVAASSRPAAAGKAKTKRAAPKRPKAKRAPRPREQARPRMKLGLGPIHRSILVNFAPSRLRLYIRPFGSRTKAMIGLVRVSVSIVPPAPKVATTIDPSTPAFQP